MNNELNIFVNEKNQTLLLDGILSRKYYKNKEYKCYIDNYITIHNLKLEIYISYCNDIIDVSLFNNAYMLCLYYCDNIVDISTLTSIHKLTLHGCKNLANNFVKGTINYLQLGPLLTT